LAGLNDQIDPATATLRCRANLLADKDSVLLPNTTVNVRMLMDTKPDATLVPAAAIMTDQNSKFVFVIAGGEVATVRPVIVGAIDRGVAEIQSGLTPGELVVIEGMDRLQKGQRINYTLSPAAKTESGQGTLSGGISDTNGGSTPFKVVATGSAPLSYQWRFNGTNIAGAAHSSSTLSNEALRLKLEYAEQELKRAEQRRNAGLVSTEEYPNAKAARDIAAAEMKGDAAGVARVKLELAETKLKLVEKQREVGAASQSEYDQAKLARDLAALELKKIEEGK